ncbi:tRNA (adenosine(37)-N6)-threonylcarbamoyltransferase complex dimerization subunit type 1 TsaB [Oricola cellulosilytica]|nr:tRNA (adenosine(37)-N6)-threonylcarbamoyltransferase complex dimerization subunit type 1 TsaB [Oricola cellulosilytica]
MLTLAIDTAANFCSACLYDTATRSVLSSEERDIGRGHAEQLMDVVSTAMRESGREFADLGQVAVSVGPGSFTGIRVGVAAARGFALALGIPAVGVTTLEAIADGALSASGNKAVTVAIGGGRGQVFMQSFGKDGVALTEPEAFDETEAGKAVPQQIGLLAGNAAADLGKRLARPVEISPIGGATGAIEAFARLCGNSGRAPVPLYLRGADAKPQDAFALPRAEGGPVGAGR